MSNLPLTLAPGAQPHRRPGRPKGAKSKRSLDLARYVEAQFGGMTPGQQSAMVSMVTTRELRRAKLDAEELGLHVTLHAGLSPFMLAMVVKAARLAIALGCERKEAWLLLQKERADLLPYVHQKRPQATDAQEKAIPLAFIVPDAPAHLPTGPEDAADQGLDLIELPADPAS